MNMPSFPNCFFQPWVGDHYWTTGFHGLRVLLLGESHYGPDIYEPGSFTQDVVCRYAVDGPTLRFFTVACRVVQGGGRPSITERTAFWHAIAFYNYIQDWVGTGPRQRPTPAQWRVSQDPFTEVLAGL